jgi:hypothetical protein
MTAIPPLVRVTRVEVIGEHELRLTFEDGTVGDVGFGGDEWTGVFEPLRSSGPRTASTWRLSRCTPRPGAAPWLDSGRASGL